MRLSVVRLCVARLCAEGISSAAAPAGRYTIIIIGQSPKGATMTTRQFQVYDGDGELVATFPEWEAAHNWAHLRANEPVTSRPVQIEDRVERRTWTIEADRCRLTVWRRRVEYGYCGSGDLRHAANARKHARAS
ncbi:hypothetical protein BMG523Draft_01255 [Frankia sp. BMG5.23]|nr:hypothetical protein BMG523Draft_01255 [Frankia sp. BMG5.23]